MYTDHRMLLDPGHIDVYAGRVFGNVNYQFDDAYFYVEGHLYKKTKEKP